LANKKKLITNENANNKQIPENKNDMLP